MLRIRFLLRMPWFAVTATAVALIVRAMASISQNAVRYPDSVGYDTVKFFTHTDRPWPIPFVFSLAGSDSLRIMFQVLLGTAAWVFLAWGLSSISRFPRTAFASTLLLGLSPQIIRYDVAILSESLSISFAVAALAATLYRLRTRTMLSNIMWGTALTLCVLSRPTHLIVVIVCLVPSTIVFVRTRARKITMTTLALLSLLGAGIVSLRTTSHVSLLNVYTVISSRVISDDERFTWFVERGMPNVPNMRTATGYDYAEELPADVAAIVQLPVGQQPPQLMRVGGVQLATWLKNNGWREWARYLITHPSDAFAHASQLAGPTLNPPNGDFLPLKNGAMIPQSTFFTWQLWTLLSGVALLVGFLQLRTRSASLLLAAAVLTTWSIYFITVHTSGIEHVRHAVTVSAMIRVLGLVSLFALWPQRRPIASLDEHDDELH